MIGRKKQERLIRTPLDFPSGDELSDKSIILQEPIVLATLVFPGEYLGPILELCMVVPSCHKIIAYILPEKERRTARNVIFG